MTPMLPLTLAVIEPAATWCAVAIAAALVLSVFRLLRGPTASDRIIALDLIAVLVVAELGLLCMLHQEQAYLSVALAVSLVSFLSTVAMALLVRYCAEAAGEGADDL